MKKRILSMFLAILMVVGLLPSFTLTASAAEYERWGGIIRLGYNAETDSWAWETFVDYDDPSLPRQYNGQLPTGVSYAEETNTLTLSATSVNNIMVESWASTPLNIIISGDVIVNGLHPDNLPSLLIDGSYAVTISGKNGDRTDKLTLYSATTHALRFGCFVPYSSSESEGHLTNSQGCLTVENLTLNATSDYSGENFNMDERWNWIAVSLTGGALFDNVALTADGYYGIDTAGNITYDGCTVTASTVSFASLEKRMDVDDPTTEYECESLIKDSTFTITASGMQGTEDFGALMRVHRNVLTIDGSSNITIDASKAPPALAPLVIAGHHELKQAGPAAGLNMKSGTLKINLQDGDELEGIVDFLDSVRIENGAIWNQTGGEVTVTVNSGECEGDMPLETHAVTVGDGASFNMQGGSFTVDNINGEDVFATKVMALCGWEDSSLNFTGGTFTATGAADKPYDVAVWVYDEMAVTGDAVLNLKGVLQTETRTSHIEIFDGTVNIHSYYECINIGSAMSVYGGEMNLTSPGCMEGIFAYQGNVRFLGGEVNITAGSALTWQTHADQITFGEGIKAAYPDGTEATVKELYYGEYFLGWATDTDYIYNDFDSVGKTVTIKKQGVKADVTEPSLAFELTNTAALVAGVPVNFRIIPILTSTSGTLAVTLPNTLIFGGVTVNNLKVDPVVTADGFSLTINNGDIIRFTATPNAVGKITTSASVHGVASVIDFDVENYTLSVPSVIKYPDFTVFGSSVPGSTVTFYEKNGSLSTPIGSTTSNAAGTWKAALRVNGIAGPHTIYASVTLGGNTIATSRDYVVTYDDSRAVVETLTITNTIHGATTADPDEEVSVTLNYIDGTRTQNYYIYWPELPEFRFDVKFAGEKSTPTHISDVAVIATDRLGEEARVPLTYDAVSGLWSGTHEFCNYGNIVPDRFRVAWREVGFTEEDEETTGPVDMPSRRDEPDEYRDDYTTDAFVYVEPGVFELLLVDGTTEIGGVTTITGETVEYTVAASTCSFTASAGEMYIVNAIGSLTGEYEGRTRLLVICTGGTGSTATLQDNVIEVPEGCLVFGDTAGTFTSNTVYQVDDVIHAGDGLGVVVTGADDGVYTYRDAYIGEIYKTLDVGTMNTNAISWQIDEEEIAAQFMASPLFASYAAALEVTFSDEYELGDHEVGVEVTAHADTDGVLSIEPVVTITTKSKTKLPNEAEQETTITTTFSGSVEQDYDFRVRYDGDTENFALYFATTNAITNGLDINVGLTIGEGESENANLAEYFDEIEEEIIGNFLEALRDESDKTATITFTKLSIPTPVPGVVVYAEPSVELNWGFFGEMGLGATVTASSKSGFAVTCFGGEWVTATFGKFNPPELSANARLHVTSFIEAMLRVDAGVSLLRVFDAGIYAKVGPRLDLAGHGSAQYPSDDRKAELTVRFGLRAEAGAHLGIGISDRVTVFDADIPVFEQYLPLGFVGWGEMPTRFDIIEGPDPVLKPKEYYIVEHIPLDMQLQNFGDGEGGGTKVYSENNYKRYSFEVLDGPVHIEGIGEYAKLVVNDPTIECTYSLRITFDSNNYTLYKVVPLLYKPGYIEVRVSAEEEPPIANIEITDLDDPENVYTGSTDAGGYLIMDVPDGRYSVAQTSAPNRNYLASASPIEPVVVLPGGDGHASFDNKLLKEKETFDFPLPDIGDPSGYVYEGIESNRLDGVKTTIYYKPTETSDAITIWDATAYDQQNPLYTDVLGQYLWMVPSGWWQVKYELDGYTTVLGEWMEVPPIRTGVNVNLTSTQPAEMEIEYSEQSGYLLLRFNRPVKLNTLSNVSIVIDGVPYEGGVDVTAADAAWSVTIDPSESAVCATVFRVWIEDSVVGKNVVVSVDGVETYNGIVETVSNYKDIPAQTVSYTITFDANGGSVVPASDSTDSNGRLTSLPIPTRDGYTFDGWFTAAINGVRISADYVFTANVTIYAQWTENPYLPTNHTVTYTDGVDGVEIFADQRFIVAGGSDTPAFVGIPTRDGYTFMGWSPTVASKVTETIVYKAVWVEDTVTEPEDGFDYDYWYWILTMLYNQEFEITASATEGGMITPAGVSKVKYDKDITYTITPMEGYAIADVLVDGKSVGVVSEYTIKRIKADHTISAIFAKTVWENPYADVSENAWYYKAIEFVSENGLMVGTGTNIFEPNIATSRAMIVTILWRLEGSPIVNYAMDFEDVAADQWYTEAIRWAASEKIVEGYGNGQFGTNDAITREQMVTIMFRYAKYKGYDVSVGENTNILSYDDAFDVAEWAIPAMQWACGSGMIQGIADGSMMNLAPQGNATRAQAAAILQRYCENVANKD